MLINPGINVYMSHIFLYVYERNVVKVGGPPISHVHVHVHVYEWDRRERERENNIKFQNHIMLPNMNSALFVEIELTGTINTMW